MTNIKSIDSSNRLSANKKEECVLAGSATSEADNVEPKVSFEFDHVPFVKYLLHLFCEVSEEKCQHITTSYLEHQNQEELELKQEKEWSWTEPIIKSFAISNNNNLDDNSCIQAYRSKNINHQEHHTNNKKTCKETNFLVKKRLLVERYYIDHYNYESTSTDTLEKVLEIALTSPSKKTTAANATTTTEAAGTQLIGKENIITNINLSNDTKGNIKVDKGNTKENNKFESHSASGSEHNSMNNTETLDSNSAKPAITLQQRLRICLLCALGFIDKECTLAKALSLNWSTRNFDEEDADKHAPVLHLTHVDQEHENKEIQANNDNIRKFATDVPPEERSSLHEQQIQTENFVPSDADICLSRKIYISDANMLTIDGNKELCEHDCEPNNDTPCLYFALHQNELCASAVCEWIEDVLEFIITNEFSVEQACCILTCAKELLSKLERMAENDEYEADGNIEESICAFLKDTLHTYTVEVHKNVKEKCHRQEEVEREMPDPDVVAKLKARLARDKLSKKQIVALEEELKHVPVISCTVVEDKIVEVERQITVGPYFESAKEVQGIYEFLRDAVLDCWRLLHYVLCTNSKSFIASEQKEESHYHCTQSQEKMLTEYEEQQKLAQQKECTNSASSICETDIHREMEVIEPFCVIPLCTFLPENLLPMEHERQELLTNFTEGLLAIYEKEFIAEWYVIAHEECNARTALVQKINSDLQENKALAMSKNEYLQTKHALLTRLETKVEDNKLIERKVVHNECDVQNTSLSKNNSNVQYNNNNKKRMQENANNTKNMATTASAINTTNTTDVKKNNGNVLPKVNKLKTEKMKTLPPKANASTNKTVLPRLLEASASSSLEPSLPQTFTISDMFSKKADNVDSTAGPYECAAQEFNLANVLSRLATIEERCDQIELSASASKSASGSDLRRKKEDLT